MRRTHLLRSRSANSERSRRFSVAFWTLLFALGSISPADAAITATGDVSPGNLATWNDIVTGYVGYTGAGTLAVNSGSTLTSDACFLGYNSGSTGTVTVSGAGSAWDVTSPPLDPGGPEYNPNLYVGCSGNAALKITNGGTVSDSDYTCLGYNSGSTGTVTVDGLGSTLGALGLYVGCGGSGTITVTNGGTLSGSGSIGFGSTGTVTVDGPGSTWRIGSTGTGALEVGASGSGTLNITNGAAVSGAWATFVGDAAPGSNGTGSINFGANGGTLTTGTLLASPSQLTGTGTINATGLVSDVNLVFDAAHPLKQTISLNGLPNQNVTLNLDMSNGGDIGVGYQGNGSLTVKDGIALTSGHSYIGYWPGSTGTVTVDGTGSTWTTSIELFVGSGTLNITNGGAVSAYSSVIAQSGAVVVDGRGSTFADRDPAGFFCDGTLKISNGGATTSGFACIGNGGGSTGTVTVDGRGSTWTEPLSSSYLFGNIYVGYQGNGSLNITNGGAVSAGGTTYVGWGAGCTGAINFGANGGTLTTGALWASPSQLTGTGTINATGLVSDANLVFDGAHGAKTTVTFNSLPNQDVTINLDLSNPANNGALGAGYQGAGSLTVKNGIAVTSACGYIGYWPGSSGTATVDGHGSAWTANCPENGGFFVGYYGNGTLDISNGGTVTVLSSSNFGGSYIGYNSGSTGSVTVDGPGSTWTMGGIPPASGSFLYLGYSGN